MEALSPSEVPETVELDKDCEHFGHVEHSGILAAGSTSCEHFDTLEVVQRIENSLELLVRNFAVVELLVVDGTQGTLVVDKLIAESANRSCCHSRYQNNLIFEVLQVKFVVVVQLDQ